MQIFILSLTLTKKKYISILVHFKFAIHFQFCMLGSQNYLWKFNCVIKKLSDDNIFNVLLLTKVLQISVVIT